jgi:hypothetical protein
LLEELNVLEDFMSEIGFESECEEGDLDCILAELEAFAGDIPDFESACEETDFDCIMAELMSLSEGLDDVVGELDDIAGEIVGEEP